MKGTWIFLLFLLPGTLLCQVKIDSGYQLMNSGRPITDTSGSFYIMIPDSMQVKELASGKICRIVSYEASFRIQSEIFKANDKASFLNYLNYLKPKDQIFLDKIKLEPNCFAPPKSVVIGIR